MSLRNFLGVLVLLTAGAVDAELIRVNVDPAIWPGQGFGAPVDIDEDGTNEFGYFAERIVTLDYPSSGGTTAIYFHRGDGFFLLGSGSSAVPLAAGERIGPVPVDGTEWITNKYKILLASRSHNFRSGQSSDWSGVLADPAKPFIGIQYHSEHGIHYGWIRFGWLQTHSVPYLEMGRIIEWAFESVPDTPVTISVGPVTNDLFADALFLPGTHGRFWTDNSTATMEAGEPALDPPGAGSSLWWKWTAPTNGMLHVVSNVGSFDTVLGVFTGDDPRDLTLQGTSSIRCVNGVQELQREVELPVISGQEYYVLMDSRRLNELSSPHGEVHLEYTFSTVSIGYPQAESEYPSIYPVHLTASVSDFDGATGTLTFEADGEQIAIAQNGASNASWYSPEIGAHEIRAVWTTTEGVVRKSVARLFHVRPANDNYVDALFIRSSHYAERVSNYYATREEGEFSPPEGSDSNSVWWRWTAPEDGVITVAVPDGGGEMSISVCWGDRPWVDEVVELVSNPADPHLPGKKLNHVQLPVGRGATYAIAIRSSSSSGGSWNYGGVSECSLPQFSGRDFDLQFSFTSRDAGRLLATRITDEMMGTFAAPAGRAYFLECSSDLGIWHEVEQGVTTGMMQVLRWPIDSLKPQEFFRLKVGE